MSDSHIELFETPGIYQTPSYRNAAKVGNTIYVAGQVAKDENGVLVAPNDAEGQARLVYHNLGEVLKAAGATPQDVVKITTFLTHREDSPTVSKIRFEFFGEHRPPHTGLIVAGLGSPEVRLEVEVIAVVNDQNVTDQVVTDQEKGE